MFSDEMISLATQDGAILGYAVEVDTGERYFRTHTGLGEILIDGDTYYGVGELGDVQAVNTESDTKPVRASVTLNGLNVELVGEAMKAQMRGNFAQVMLLVFDPITQLLLRAEPSVIGFIVDYNVSITADSGALTVEIADEFERYEMPLHKYWTDENHQLEHNGDRLCRYVAQMGDRSIYWGAGNDATAFNKVV